MLRRLVLALGLAMLPLAAGAAPTPAPPAAQPPDHVRDGGMIAGRVVSVDYQLSVMSVDGMAAGKRGRYTVMVMPTTSIQGKGAAYYAFTDVKSGEDVQIMSSIADGKYVAQIIRIR